MASSNNFYGSSATNRGGPPKPPPKPATSTSATTRRATAASRSKPSTYQSSRSVPPSRPSGSNPASKTMPPSRTKPASSSTRSSGTLQSRSLGARKAPKASRPVGSYYNSSAATGSDSMNSGVASAGAANPYAASSVPASGSTTVTTDTADNDDWDDWGSPSPAKPTTTTAKATTNPHASWAAPSKEPAAASAPADTGDWYSAGGSASNMNAPAPSSGGYTSAGFINQPTSQPNQQQQQQQQNPMQPGSGFFQANTTQQQQQQQQQPFLSGAMDSSAPTMSAMKPDNNANSASMGGVPSLSSISTFVPLAMSSMNMASNVMNQPPQGPTDTTYPSIEDEAPLLEELGINLQHMLLKSKAVVFPFSRFGGDQIDPAAICQDGDLPGPICLMLLLGGEMVLTGKLQFGYIYIYGLFGFIVMTLLVNLISPTDSVSFWTVTSIMGYALLPVNILALVKIFVMNTIVNLQLLGNILGALTVLWSTIASTRLLELGCGLRDQRYLIMYPLLLFYSAFVMMTIL